jgi:hypothetical protein
MGAIRFRSARARAAGAALLWISAPVFTEGAPLRDAPVPWFDDDARDIAKPGERDPNLTWDGIDATLQGVERQVNFGRLGRRLGTLFGGDPVRAASDVNALDEVPNSTWFTNRIGLRSLSPEEVAFGPGSGQGPDPGGVWTIVAAKTEGVTPGFRIRDGLGGVYLLKFDSPEDDGMASGAGVITGKLLYACGYNVTEDGITSFLRANLVVGANVRLTLPTGEKRAMTEADVDSILVRVKQAPDGSYRAVASKFLDGEPVGPFDWSGRRKDDPNDRISHEHRRTLRGLRLIAAWLNHFDAKQGNTLDMYVEQDGRHFLRHHLIDFASTLGAGANGARPAFGFEYSFDFAAIGGRTLALGLHEDAWRRIERPDSLAEIGFFESREFDPDEWKPLVPNAAFANMTSRDAYWAAKIISAFTDEHLRAAVETGRFRDPNASAYMVQLLAERRDKIARKWFDRMAPLDFFELEGDSLRFRDLGAERGIYPGTMARYRARLAAVTSDGDHADESAWIEADQTALSLTSLGAGAMPPAESHPFWAVRLQVNRGRGWSSTVMVCLARGRGRVVEVER